jgi:ATP-dependent DNA ligase
LQSTLPRGDHWRYEPKLDGFRGLLWRRTAADVQLLSRNVKVLTSWFPEIVQAARELPTGTLLDGEIVIADELGRSDFGALQHRMSVAKRASAAAALERPAVLLVFDLLRLGDTDLTVSPFCKRRDALEQLVAGRHPCLQLVEQTADFAEAEDWLSLLPIEGVVAKRADGYYLPGRRNEWIKVKRQRTADCVIIGIANGVRGPSLVLGLRHADGELHHFGVTQPVSESVMTVLTPILKRAGPEESAIRSRWQHDAVPPWRRVPAELVCEVTYTTLDGGRWLRQPGRFLRWRPDRSPEECSLDQLETTSLTGSLRSMPR